MSKCAAGLWPTQQRVDSPSAGSPWPCGRSAASVLVEWRLPGAAVRVGAVQAPATSRRCQRSSVSGLTKKQAQRERGRARLSAASTARSACGFLRGQDQHDPSDPPGPADRRPRLPLDWRPGRALRPCTTSHSLQSPCWSSAVSPSLSRPGGSAAASAPPQQRNGWIDATISGQRTSDRSGLAASASARAGFAAVGFSQP
jgi:hypothetical protein